MCLVFHNTKLPGMGLHATAPTATEGGPVTISEALESEALRSEAVESQVQESEAQVSDSILLSGTLAGIRHQASAATAGLRRPRGMVVKVIEWTRGPSKEEAKSRDTRRKKPCGQGTTPRAQPRTKRRKKN